MNLSDTWFSRQREWRSISEVEDYDSSDVITRDYNSIDDGLDASSYRHLPKPLPAGQEARLLLLNELRYWVVLILVFSITCLVYGCLLIICQVSVPLSDVIIHSRYEITGQSRLIQVLTNKSAFFFYRFWYVFEDILERLANKDNQSINNKVREGQRLTWTVRNCTTDNCSSLGITSHHKKAF